MREPLAKFVADRGTHLAAMIAYFALLSLVPLVFLALALLGLAGRPDEESYVVTELKRMFPGSSIGDILEVVRAVRRNAATLGVVGAFFLLWTSLSLFSVLESAFNVVYGRPNRSFLHGKAVASALMLGSLVTLFVALLVGSLGAAALNRYAPGVIANTYVAYSLSLVISLAGIFAFLVTAYYTLTNAPMTLREVLPGAAFAAILLQASFQALPIYLGLADLNVVLRVFGGPAILLVWLYLTANLIVFGAEINWWRCREAAPSEEGVGLA